MFPSPHRDCTRLKQIPTYDDFVRLEKDLRKHKGGVDGRARQDLGSDGTLHKKETSASQQNKRARTMRVALVGFAGAEESDLVMCEHARMDGWHASGKSTHDGKSTRDVKSISNTANRHTANPVRAIFYDQTSEHHLARQAVRNGEWVRDTRIVAGKRGEAPRWHLADSSGKKIVMHDASAFGQLSSAAQQGDWHLTTVYDQFTPAGSSAIHGPGGSGSGGLTATGILASIVDANLGVHVLGVRTRERVITPGTTLTAIGEVYLNKSNEMRFRKPLASGSNSDKTNTKKSDQKNHFAVTTKSFETFVAGFGRAGRVFEVIGTGCFCVGVTLVAVKLARARLVKRRDKAFRARLALAEEARLQNGDDENVSGLAPGETCVVCLYSKATAVYKECGHLVCCEVCAARMSKCPLCRKQGGWMKVYRAGG